MIHLVRRMNGLFDRIPQDVVALALRFFPAAVFWLSGRTKVEGVFTIKDSTWFLFAHEYALPVILRCCRCPRHLAEHMLPVC